MAKKMESRSARVSILALGDPAKATAEKPVVKMVEGVYLGTEKPSFADSLIHYFRNNKGERIAVWGSAGIDRALETIPKDTATELEYLGLKELPGGKTFKEIDVRVPEGTPVVANNLPF